MRLTFSLFVALASVGGAIACRAAKEDTRAAVAGSEHTPPTPGTTQDGAGRPRDNVKWSTAAVQPVSSVRLRPDIAITVLDTRAKVVLGSVAVRANIAMEIRGNAAPL
jgi:hypothetical protein